VKLMLAELFQEVRSALEERVNRLKKRAVAVAAAGFLLALAFLFALLAAFIELQRQVGSAMAALIIFVVLLAAGVGALMIGREKKPSESARQLQKSTAAFRKTAEDTALTSSGWPLILTAFAAGLALARGRFNGGRKARH
jgi:cobalamin biosynthesis protein CobD/CbiB